MKKLMSVGIISILLSCAADIQNFNKSSEVSLKKRASFDLNCSESKLKITVLDSYPDGEYKQLGITGCGRKATYVKVYTGWVMNSAGN